MENYSNYIQVRVENMNRSDLLTIIRKHVDTLIADLSTEADSEYIAIRLTDILSNNYKHMLVGEIFDIFNQLYSGQISIKKVSVNAIITALQQYKTNEVERNKIYQSNWIKTMPEIETIKSESGLPMGKAMSHKLEMRMKGQISPDDWDNKEVGIKRIAKDIQDGKICPTSDKNK